MSNFFDRIKQVADYKGYKNPSDFAKNGLGWTSSEKINRLKDNSKKPSVDILIELSNKFDDINPEWLLLGKGDMLKSKKSIPQSISSVDGNVFSNAGNIGNINIENPSKDTIYQQEIYRLQNENDILRKSNDILEREILSFKSILDQQKESQGLLKELYERKITDLKENITLLKNMLNK